MSYYALWIDHHQAYVYKFEAEGVEEYKLTAKDEKYGNAERFFHDVANQLTNVEELMLMGPGIAKDQFKHHCEKDHQHKKVSQSIVGVTSMEAHPTKAMMLKKATDFFKTYHKWVKNY